MDAYANVPTPVNEPNLTYAPGSPERAELELELVRQESVQVDFTATIGGEKRRGGGEEIKVVQPHDHAHVLGTIGSATTQDTEDAVAAALAAAPAWRDMPFEDRAAIILKAADLLAGP